MTAEIVVFVFVAALRTDVGAAAAMVVLIADVIVDALSVTIWVTAAVAVAVSVVSAVVARASVDDTSPT